MAFGLIPAFRLSRGELNQALASGSRRQGQGLSRRGGQWLIATEVAFAVVLVVGAGLMIRSFARIMNVDVGFDPASIVTMQVQPISAEDGAQARFYPELLRAIRAIPGVEAAGAVDDFALSRVTTFTTGRAEGRRAGTESRQTTPGYLEALGIEPVEGRLPTEADAAAGREIIVLSETLAHDLFPDGLALGRQVQVGRRTLEVVGVVPDLRHGGPLRRPVSADAFLPFANRASGNERGAGLRRSLGLTVVVRPRGEVPDLAGRLRQAAQSIGPPVLVEGIRSGTDWLSDRVVTPRRRTVMLGLLGALGLVLALVGIFGMTAYAVSRRTREIGVRMAFGARPGQVVGTMVRDALTPLVVGTLVGLAGAAAATRVIANFLFETEATDPATFATVAVLLTCAGLLAAWVPALRAARVDPVTTLRAE
jgi:predicted permease